MIEVTAAVIYKDGKLLLCQRPKGKRCELLWEFPGGKIEPGETPEECLIRECQEELGIAIKPERPLGTIKNDDTDETVIIHFFLSSIVTGAPACLEHNNIQWCTMDEIVELPLCPADSDMLSVLRLDSKNII